MKANNLDKFKKLVSDDKSGWLEKAKWRQENQDWLDISFAIAVKILATFRVNKKTNTFPKNQKELAKAMGCSPQYVNKLLKGAENLQLETITKVERILNIKLIQIPEFETSLSVVVPKYLPYIKVGAKLNSSETATINYNISKNEFSYADAGVNILKLAS